MSPASTGSVDEPAAWGVLRVGGGWVSILANEVQAETSRKSWDARENWVHEVIPLYRLPMLTGEEREAVEYFAWGGTDKPLRSTPLPELRHRDSLRRLLNRTK